jgi:hypothetical protein
MTGGLQDVELTDPTCFQYLNFKLHRPLPAAATGNLRIFRWRIISITRESRLKSRGFMLIILQNRARGPMMGDCQILQLT